jgi:hypothetical protein
VAWHETRLPPNVAAPGLVYFDAWASNGGQTPRLFGIRFHLDVAQVLRLAGVEGATYEQLALAVF